MLVFGGLTKMGGGGGYANCDENVRPPHPMRKSLSMKASCLS